MAFSYRNTLDSALSALPQRYSDQILADPGDKIDYKLRNIQKLFSYRVSPEIQELLAESGIELAPISYQNHSHPACKMIENHILYVSLPNLLQNEYAIGLMSLRESKKKRFIKMRRFLKNGDFQGVKMFNSIIDTKDIFRYDPKSHIGDFSSRVAAISKEFKEPGFNARVMLIHDELHFHSPENIMELFENVNELRAIVGTVVCPPELLQGDTMSKNPRIYSFEVEEGNLNFFPDSCPSEGYVQPLSTTLWYLKTSEISKGGLKLRVSVIQSIFAHHVIVIDRLGKSSKGISFYQKPPCLLNSELQMLDKSFTHSQIERGTMSSIITYLSCLKTPNAESALAKLRQLEKRPLFSDEMYLVSTIAHSFSKVKFNGQDLRMSYIDQIRDSVCGSFPWLMSFFMNEKVWQVQYRNFLKEISCKWFKVSLTKIELKNDKVAASEAYLDFQTLAPEMPIKFNFERVEIPESYRRPPQPINDKGECSSSAKPILAICDKVIMDTEDHGSRNQSSICRADQCSTQSFSKLSNEVRRNSCVFDSVAPQIDMTSHELICRISAMDVTENLLKAILDDKPLNFSMISEVANLIGRAIVIDFEGKELIMGMGSKVFIKLNAGHCTPALPYECESLKPKIPSLGSVNYEASSDKARRLVKSLTRGTTGVLLSSSEEMKVKAGELEHSLSMTDCFDSQISYTWGAPGSGKTKGIIKSLRGDDSLKAFVVSPRRLLADDWVDSLLGANSKVFTHETALIEDVRMFNVFIFDEVTLLPPGYIDLFLFKVISSRLKKLEIKAMKTKLSQKKIQKILNDISFHVIGDPMQSRYYSESDEIILSRKHDVETLVENGACKMLWKSYRMGSWFEKLMDIPCLGSQGESKIEKFLFFSGLSAVKGKFDVILCSSREDKRNLAGHIPVMTFGESQGLTFNRALIAITDSTHKVSDHHIYVGLTRSREQFHFIVTSERSLNENLKVFEKKLLGYVLKQEQIKRERLSSLFSNSKKAEFISEESFGSALSEKLYSDPFIMPFADLTETTTPEELKLEEVICQKVNMKCHLPICKVNPLNAEVFEKLGAKEHREAYSISMGSTEQFRDTDAGKCSFDISPAFSMQAIFPKHTSTDSATFALGVKKRLRFSNPRNELNELRAKTDEGRQMAEFFLKNLPGRFVISKDDIENGQNEFNQRRASKPTVLFANHSNRSEIDWPLDWVFIFMKSQLCTKSEKMYSNAKAGQTLACFHHIILFKFGPVLRAIELAFERAVGDKFYIHSRKDFSSLNSFALDNIQNFQGLSTESDYEAFDSSQDSTILAFEVALLEKLGISRDFIRDYISLKTTLGSKLGNFAIMRFTGEFCTFLFNTFANMLFTFLKYEIHPETRMLFAGDDMASIGQLKRRSDGKERLLDGLRLKAKEEKKKFPMFCGWLLTPDGIYKKPSLLWARLMVMKEKGELKSCIDNYLLEMAWAYRMGEDLFKYLDEDEMEFHYKCVRFFIEKSSMCRGEALKVVKTFGATFGSTNNSRPKGRDYLGKIVSNIVNRRDIDQDFRVKMGEWPEKIYRDGGPASQKLQECLTGLSRPRQKEMDEKVKNVGALRDFKIVSNFNTLMAKHRAKGPDAKCSNYSQLGQAVSKVEIEVRECQLSRLMTFYSDQRQRSSELMQLIQGRSTRMQISFLEKCLTVSGGLNPTLKFMGQQMRLASRGFQSLMTMKFDGSREKLGSLITYILEQSCSGSHHYFQMHQKLQEQCLSQIQQCLTRSKVTLLHSTSHLGRVLHSFQSGRDIVYQFLIRIFNQLLRCLYNSLGLGHGKVVNLLDSISGSCTGLPTPQDFYQVGLGQMDGLHRRFKGLKESVTGQVCQLHKHTSLNTLMSLAKEGAGAYSYLKECLEVESIRLSWQKKEKLMEEQIQKLKGQSWGSLGRPQLDMKEAGLNLLVNMSLQEITRAGIRSRVKRFLWSSFIDPGQDLIAADNLPALPAEPVGVHLEIYDRVLNYYMPILFGNMAILGVSGKVIWPTISIPIPNLNFEAGGEQVNWMTELVLSEVCPALEGWRNTSDFQPLRHGTLRNLAEPFAMEAMKFLKERRQFNVYTNIYIKLPRAFEMAPWVAFDFASGLDLNTLNNDEKTVMERMNTRIFRTEGQKVAFRAQGEANLSLEG
nr:polyprotein [Tea A virus]